MFVISAHGPLNHNKVVAFCILLIDYVIICPLMVEIGKLFSQRTPLMKKLKGNIEKLDSERYILKLQLKRLKEVCHSSSSCIGQLYFSISDI